MAAIVADRMAGLIEGEYVVFLIGMRINRWWKIGSWLPVISAMPRMLRELGLHPELGFLGGQTWFARTTVMVSYWRSMDQLLGYAASKSGEHLPAWQQFNRRVGTNGDVGIWHETFRVRPGDSECMYVNMPPFGVGAAGQLIPARGARGTARQRLEAGKHAASAAGQEAPAE